MLCKGCGVGAGLVQVFKAGEQASAQFGSTLLSLVGTRHIPQPNSPAPVGDTHGRVVTPH